MTTATTPATAETEIRALTEEWADALRRRDVDAVMTGYAPDLVVFGITPPLHYRGLAQHRKHWESAVGQFQGPIGYEIRDQVVTVSGDVALSTSVNRLSGTSKNGETSGNWMRVTVGYRRIGGRWMVIHEHVSVPFDPKTGKAQPDLEP